MATDPHTINLDKSTHCAYLFCNINSHMTTCNLTYRRILYYRQDSIESYIMGGILIKSTVQIMDIILTYRTQYVLTLATISWLRHQTQLII